MTNIQQLVVTGYKSIELGIFKPNDPAVTYIKKALTQRLRTLAEEGLQWVIIGGQNGTEIWTGEVVVDLKKDFPDLKLAIITPFTGHESQWKEDAQMRYHNLVSQADFTLSTSPDPYQNPSQFALRDELVFAKTQGALIFYDEEREGSPQYFYRKAKQLAELSGYEVHRLDFYDIQSLVEEEQWSTDWEQ